MLNYFTSLLSALQSYRASHAGLSPDAIVIGKQIFESLKLTVNSYIWKDDEFENVPLIIDEHETLWHFEGSVPALEHRKCCVCGMVIEKNQIDGHSLDGDFVCETCYNRIKHNLPPMMESEQKTIEGINEMMKSTMSKDYLKAYGKMLFGEKNEFAR